MQTPREMRVEARENEDIEELENTVREEIRKYNGGSPKCCGDEMSSELSCNAGIYVCEICKKTIVFEFDYRKYPAEPDVGIMESYIEVELEGVKQMDDSVYIL